MIKLFHLSFVVPNLDAAKRFYIDVLGCEVGRDVGEWIDILFFGHQVTIHQEKGAMLAKPLDHFGVIMDENEWLNTSSLLSLCTRLMELHTLMRDTLITYRGSNDIIKSQEQNVYAAI